MWQKECFESSFLRNIQTQYYLEFQQGQIFPMQETKNIFILIYTNMISLSICNYVKVI